MAFFEEAYRYGLWVAPPMFFFGLVLLIAAIIGVVTLVRTSVLARVPLAERQQVEFADAGSVVLCMEGPLLSRRFKGLRYTLTDAAGAAVGGRHVLPVSSSGFSRGRRTLWLFRVPQAGAYTLHVENLGAPRPNDAEHEFVFTRPHFAKVVVYIVTMIAAAALIICGIVLFGLRLMEVNPGLHAGPPAAKSTLVVVTWIVAVFGSALVLGLRSEGQHKRAVRALAARQGWSISTTDAFGISDAVKQLFPERTLTCHFIMTVGTEGHALYLVDGAYCTLRPHPNPRPTTVCLLESERFGHVQRRVEIRHWNPADRALLRHQVKLDDSEFARNFMVICEDPDYARSLLNPALQQAVLAHNRKPICTPVEIVMAPGRLAMFCGYVREDAQWLDVVELAEGIERSF